MEDIRSGKSSPLKNITSNYHYHKVSADSEETLDLIEQELREKGFLLEERRQAVKIFIEFFRKIVYDKI